MPPILGIIVAIIFVPIGIWVIVDSFNASNYEASWIVIFVMGVFFFLLGFFGLLSFIFKILKDWE